MAHEFKIKNSLQILNSTPVSGIYDTSTAFNGDSSTNQSLATINAIQDYTESYTYNKLYIDGSLSVISLWDISTNGSTVYLKDPSDNLEISSLEMKENGGALPFIDMPISDVSVDSEQSYDFRIDGSSALKIYGKGDGSALSETAVVINTQYQYFGDPNTNGSWRFYITSNNFTIQKRVSGTWTTIGYFTDPSFV